MNVRIVSGKYYHHWVRVVVGAILLCLNVEPVTSENILVLLPLGTRSHKNVIQPLIDALAERGHNLTVVSPFQPSKEKKNVREVVPTDFSAALSRHFGNAFEIRRAGKWGVLSGSLTFALEGCHSVYLSPEFSNLINEKFDLIFLDAFMNDCMAGFVHKLDSPFILFIPLAAPTYIAENTGNRLPPSFVPNTLFPYADEMSFFQRLSNLSFNFIMSMMYMFEYFPAYESVYRQHLDKHFPGVSDVLGNVSMLFMNSHFTLTFPRPTLPDVVEIGGMHCRPAKPLPEDLEEFVKGAEAGVIYFSLGSIVQGNQLPESVRQIFVNVFSRLSQRVLWKWESEDLPDLPENVKLSKWLPQQDILGHKNVKLFITHGGLLSTQETTYHGVPLIGIPIFGDQDFNMQQAKRSGYGLTIEILDITEEKLERAITEILTNDTYTSRAREVSRMYRDQIDIPVERAVFWSEYVMRHKGAIHLRSAARKLNFIQYYSIDVVSVLGATLLILLYLVKVIIFKTFSLLLVKRFSGKADKVDVVQEVEEDKKYQ